jgi:cupin 2 domain-containing protein
MGRGGRYANEFLVNLFDYDIPKEGEDFTTILEQGDIRIMRIVSSDNVKPELYIQDEDEWVVVLEGEAAAEIDGKRVQLGKGDTLFIPAKTPHRVLSTKNGTVWLAIHFLN